MTLKDELRKEMRILKKQQNPEILTLLSQEILHKIETKAVFESSHTMMAFYALPDEVQTPLFLSKWKQEGKRILLPVVIGEEIKVKTYQGEASMQSGALRVMEPDGSDYFEDYDAIDLILVPGVAFDAQGHRMGRGRGFYDRFLPRLKKAYKLGVCYPFQWVAEVPFQAHDIAMDEVVYR